MSSFGLIEENMEPSHIHLAVQYTNISTMHNTVIWKTVLWLDKKLVKKSWNFCHTGSMADWHKKEHYLRRFHSTNAVSTYIHNK
jgi:hypothetical protein